MDGIGVADVVCEAVQRFRGRSLSGKAGSRQQASERESRAEQQRAEQRVGWIESEKIIIHHR